jgi:uncharacterized protein YukE
MDFLGNRDSVERVANALLVANEIFLTANDNLTGGVSQLVPGRWHGAAASGFQDRWATESSSINALAATMAQIATVLDDLASELRRAERIAIDGRTIAESAGLEVGPDGHVFDHLGGARLALPLQAHQEMVRAEAQERIDLSRSVADTAREQAVAQLSAVAVPAIGDHVTVPDADAQAHSSAPGLAGWFHQNGGSLAADMVQIGAGGTSVEAGLGMIGAGVGGEVGGVALDATAAGAVVGVPLNVASAPLVVAGGALALGGTVVAGAGLSDGVGRVVDGIGVLFARKQQPPELSAAEREALENKAHGKPYDQRAYKDAVRKIRRGEKFQGERNKQKRAGS